MTYKCSNFFSMWIITKNKKNNKPEEESGVGNLSRFVHFDSRIVLFIIIIKLKAIINHCIQKGYWEAFGFLYYNNVNIGYFKKNQKNPNCSWN